jgi:hypothetical protein
MNGSVLIVRDGRKGSAGGRNPPLSYYGQEQMLRLRQFMFTRVVGVDDRPLTDDGLIVFSFSGLARAVESAQILVGEKRAVKVFSISLMERADLQWDFRVAELERALSLIWNTVSEGTVSLIVIVGQSALSAILAEALRDQVLQTKGGPLNTPENGEGYLVSLSTGEVMPVRQAEI